MQASKRLIACLLTRQLHAPLADQNLIFSALPRRCIESEVLTATVCGVGFIGPSWQGECRSCSMQTSRHLSSSRCLQDAGSKGDSSSSSSSKQSAGTGPPVDRLKALPFLVKPIQAEEAFQKYQRSNWLLTAPSKYEKMKEVLLPFWMIRAQAQVQLNSVQVGFRRYVNVYNPSTRSYQMQQRVDWQHVNLGGQSQMKVYSPEMSEMQVYASFKYPRADIHRLRPGPLLQMARALSDEVLQSSSGPTGTLRRVGPYTMPPDAARNFASAFVSQNERRTAELAIQRQYQADEVQLLDMDVRLVSFVAHPVYVPAYVFRRRHQGTKVTAFVSGMDVTAVAGTHTYDATKMAAVAAAAGIVGCLATGVAASWAPLTLFWIGGVLPGAAAAAWARFFPGVRQQVHRVEANRQSQQFESLGATSAEAWEEEWVREYLAQESRRRVEEESYSTREEDEPQARGAANDPRGFYATLGIAPGCSTSDVQAAFRAAALKNHPDRQPPNQSAAAKEASTRAFRKVMDAYTVLRDPVRRAEYDAGRWHG